MAVYKRGEVYHYEFELRGRRFRGATGCKNKREAEEFTRRKRQEKAKEAERREALGWGPLTWGVAATRYWHENGQHHSATTHTLRSLAWLTAEIGDATPLSDINGSLVARLVAKRRGDGVGPATVNRTMTEALRRVLSRARLWGEHLPPIEWRKHILPEPKERVRELRAEEEKALFEALRPEYHTIVRFALLTGCRLAECTGLRWQDVDWGGRVIWIRGKGNKLASIPLDNPRPSVAAAAARPSFGNRKRVHLCCSASFAGRAQGRTSPDRLSRAENRVEASRSASWAERPSISTIFGIPARPGC